MGCNLRDLANAEDINLAELKGKRVGIDAFLTAFQFLTTIRDRSPTGDGGPLRDSKGGRCSPDGHSHANNNHAFARYPARLHL